MATPLVKQKAGVVDFGRSRHRFLFSPSATNWIMVRTRHGISVVMPAYRSLHLLEGVTGAYPRALYGAVGVGREAQRQPFVAIANSWSEVVAGHNHLRILADEIKRGIAEAGGTPREFNTIAACDGIAHGGGGEYRRPTGG